MRTCICLLRLVSTKKDSHITDRLRSAKTFPSFRAVFSRPYSFIGRSPYAIGPLSCLSVCPVLSYLRSWCIVAKRLHGSDQDETQQAGRHRPRRLCVRWEPSPPPSKKGHNLANFRPMSIVAKRSPISAAAELLYFIQHLPINTQDREKAIVSPLLNFGTI